MGLELNLNRTIKGLKIATASLAIMTGLLFGGSVNQQNKYLNRDKEAEEVIYKENPWYINPHFKSAMKYNAGMLGTASLAIFTGLSFMGLNDKKKKYSVLKISVK